MEIKFDSEAAATIASAAIFDSLTAEARNDVIKQAVQALLTPEEDPRSRGYGVPKKTPLQIAFEQAIREAAFKAVAEKVKEDPRVQEEIDTLLGPLLNKALEAEAEQYHTSLSEHLGDALGHWLADKAREGRN